MKVKKGANCVMSMRLQAKMMEKLSSHIEESYLRQQDVVVLENVPAEMTAREEQFLKVSIALVTLGRLSNMWLE